MPLGHTESGQLKPLESVHLFVDGSFVRAGRAGANPMPLLNQQLAVDAVGLEVDRRDDLVTDQNRQGEIPQHPFLLRYIGLEAMLVAKHVLQSLALDDQRIKGRKDMDESRRDGRDRLQGFGRSPVLLPAGAVESNRQECLLTQADVDFLADDGLAASVEVANRIEADDTLCAQSPIKHIMAFGNSNATEHTPSCHQSRIHAPMPSRFGDEWPGSGSTDTADARWSKQRFPG